MDSASEPSARPSLAGSLVLAALVGASLASAMFAGDGSGTAGTLPVGGGALLVLTAALVVVALGKLPAPRLGRAGSVLLGSFVLLVAWLGFTVWWSIVPDRSWDAFNKSVAYVAFLGLGLVLAGAGRAVAARLAASMLAIVLGTTLVWALVTKAVPALARDERVARLNEPVDHWNALALLADVAIVLGLWLATTAAHRRVVRVAGALLVYVATLALLLTLSRAGVVVGVAVVAIWLALTSERVPSGLVLVSAAGPALLVAGWAFTRDALTEDLAPYSERVSDGRVFGVLALVGAAVVVLVVAFALGRSLGVEGRRKAGRWLVGLAAVLVLAAAVGGCVAAADTVSSGRECAEVVNDPSRFGSLDVSNRLCWWREAVDVYRQHAPEGAGAGTFETARKRFRPNAETVFQPHSVPLQQLADGGIVAVGFFVVVILAGIGVCVCAVRRLSDPERAAAVALIAAPAAYIGHSLVDYNWDFLAVTAPTMVALGSLAAAGREAVAPRARPILGIGMVVLAALVLVSFSFPRLSEQAERRSTRALAEGDLQTALDQARWAHFLNPVSADPWFA